MEKKYCPICGGEIIIRLYVPQLAWYIDEEEFTRADNSSSEKIECLLYCENDSEHNIKPVKEAPNFDQWLFNIEEEFNERVLQELF